MRTKIKPIPKGYNAVTPYLCVKGAAGAIAFYKKAFGAKEVMRMPGPGGTIGHAEIQIGDSRIMLHLYVADVDRVVKKALAAGAKPLRPVAEQFYGDRTGSLEDPFGHVWHVATHVEDIPMKDLKKRAVALAAAGNG